MATQLPEMLFQWQETTGWQPSADQLQQFQNFYELVSLANKSLNLTRILEPADFWEKHLWDSLQPILTNPQLVGPVVDLGTGGGFPGIPIAIARPDWEVTLVDSTAKKINFLDSSMGTIPLTNVQAIADRAESFGRHAEHRDLYGLVTVRAVAEPSVCAEYAVPLLAIGGTAILYRGHWTEAEAVSLEAAVAQLGATIANVTQFTTPLSQSLRHCIYVQKIAATPIKFPRAVGTPSQRPLGVLPIPTETVDRPSPVEFLDQ
jgi:16S rRNA (guanine527-N7)-methyltransferase